MKRAHLLSLFIVVGCGSKVGPTPRHPMSDLVQQGLKGPVKRIEYLSTPTSSSPVQVIEFDEHGGNVSSTKSTTMGRLSETRSIEYDSSFRPVRVVSKRTTELPGSAARTTEGSEEYRYTGEGCEVRKVDDLGMFKMNTVTSYDIKGHKIKETRDHSTTTFEYDVLGRLVKSVDKSEKRSSVTAYAYDYSGHVVLNTYDTSDPPAHMRESSTNVVDDRFGNWVQQTSERSLDMGSGPMKRSFRQYRRITYYAR